MKLYHLKSVAASFAASGGIGAVFGLLYSAFADVAALYGVALGLFVAGLVVVGGGLLGATEPPEGWITGRATGRGQFGRRSIVARIATEHPEVDDVSSWELAAWGVVTGGLLVGLSMILFEMAR
jgi:hypothetical protein